ncbi:hypothetical protein [Nostoc sp. UHCC 0870]
MSHDSLLMSKTNRTPMFSSSGMSALEFGATWTPANSPRSLSALSL